MNSEARRIGAALEHIKKTGNLQDFAGTRNERVAMIGAAIARGLVVWDKEREKYDLTPHGERQLGAYLAPERSLIGGLVSVRTVAAVAGLGGVAIAALWLVAGSLGRTAPEEDEVPEAALIVAPEERPAAEAEAADARAGMADHSEVAASARLRLSALSAPAKADPPGLAEPDFVTKSAAPPSAVEASNAPAGAAVPQPPENGKPVTVSLNQEPAAAPPRRPRPPVAAAATDAVPRPPTKTAPVPLPARRPPAAPLAAVADARTPERVESAVPTPRPPAAALAAAADPKKPERVEPAVSTPRPPAAALAAAADPRTSERVEPAVSPPRAAAAVPTRKPVPAPAMATGASERAAAPASAAEPAAVPGSVVAPVAEPPRRPAEPRIAAAEPPPGATPDAGAIADRARSEAEARPLPRPNSEGSVRSETRTFVYPNGTVVTVVRTPRRGEAWQREAEDAIARHSAPDPRNEGSAGLAYSGEGRALRRAAPGLPDGASGRAYGEGERSPRCGELEATEDGDRDLAYDDEDPDLADAWRQRSGGAQDRLVVPRRPPGAIEAPPPRPCGRAPYDEEAELDWRMSAWGPRFR